MDRCSLAYFAMVAVVCASYSLYASLSLFQLWLSQQLEIQKSGVRQSNSLGIDTSSEVDDYRSQPLVQDVSKSSTIPMGYSVYNSGPNEVQILYLVK